MKKYLVTGGAGFIGSNLVGSLLGQGKMVRAVDDFSTGKKENITEFYANPNFEFIEGDLSEFSFSKRAVQGIGTVFHQAAVPSVPRSIEDPVRSNKANVTATLNMLWAAKGEGVNKFVYASSSSVYGDNPDLPKKEDFPPRPISPYALTKYAGERYSQIFWHIYGLPTVCLRYFNVFGPKQDPASQYAAVIPKFISALLAGENPVVYGTGGQSRDFTFIDNIIRANLLAADSERGNGEVFNIACGSQTSLNQLIAMLEEITGKKSDPEHREHRPGDVMHSRADISKAEALLGYRPGLSLKESLSATVAWFKHHGK